MKVEMKYSVTFGKMDGSDEMSYEAELTDEEQKIYDEAIRMFVPLESATQLENALIRIYDEVRKMEDEYALDSDDEFACECLGKLTMDPDELNALVEERDEHTLDFFDLNDLDDEELDEWDANDLDKLPTNGEFELDFKPQSPFEIAWDLHVSFQDPNENKELSEEDLKPILKELFEECHGDYTTVHQYIDLISSHYSLSFKLDLLAKTVAKELGHLDF